MKMKSFAVTLLAGALVVLPIGAVSAGTGVGGVGVSIGGTQQRIVAQGNYTGQLTGGELLVEFECSAEVVGAAASTSIDSCVLHAGDGSHPASGTSLPGNAAATAGVAGVPLAPIQLCWSASARPILGPAISTSGCSALNL